MAKKRPDGQTEDGKYVWGSKEPIPRKAAGGRRRKKAT